jgi:hypothetical protein
MPHPVRPRIIFHIHAYTSYEPPIFPSLPPSLSLPLSLSLPTVFCSCSCSPLVYPDSLSHRPYAKRFVVAEKTERAGSRAYFGRLAFWTTLPMGASQMGEVGWRKGEQKKLAGDGRGCFFRAVSTHFRPG